MVLGSGWVPAADRIGTTAGRAVGHRPARVRAASGRGPRRQGPVGSHRQRSPGPRLPRPHAPLRGPRRRRRRARRTDRCRRRLPGHRPDQRLRRPRPRLAARHPVLISDHINLTGRSPLHGARFVDLTDLYSHRLRALCQEVEPGLAEGVYVQFPGPHYETPAEIRMVAAIGGSPRRDVHGARGDRGPRGRQRGARHLAGHQRRRRADGRRPQPRGGARGRTGCRERMGELLGGVVGRLR